MGLRVLLLPLALALCSHAHAHSSVPLRAHADAVVVGPEHSAFDSWRRGRSDVVDLGRADGECARSVTLYFYLHPRNMAAIHAAAEAIATPGSLAYGKHMSASEIAAIVSPPQEELDTVLAFARSHPNITAHVLATRHAIRARGPVCAFEELLSCTLHQFQLADAHGRPVGPRAIRKNGSHTLPRAVAAVVRHISPITDQLARRKGRHDSPYSAHAGGLGSKAMPGQFEASCTNSFSFSFSSTTMPQPGAALVVTGSPNCADGSTPAPTCGTGPAITGVSASFYITDSLMMSSADSPAVANVMGKCNPDISGCTFTPGLLVPLTLGVQVVVTTTYADATNATATCTVLPTFPFSSPQALAQYYGIPFPYHSATAYQPYAAPPGSTSGPSASVFRPASKIASQGIYEIADQFLLSDLTAFGAMNGIAINVSALSLLGGSDVNVTAGGEASLDVQVMMSLTGDTPTLVVTYESDGYMLAATNDMLNNLADSPLVLSVSYGWDEIATDTGLLQAADNLAMLATTGITIVTASGDNGAMGNGDCPSTVCAQCCNNFSPEFPSTSPYVVSVGGTQITSTTATPLYSTTPGNYFGSGQGEIVCSAATSGVITSGGGYSRVFPAFPAQVPAVKVYLNTSSSSTAPLWPAYNASGTLMRGYPDVALSACLYPTILNGQLSPQYGTSASTPLFASLITMLNDQRLRRGLPPVGNIVPLLYQLGQVAPDAFTDVILGNNGFASPQNSGTCTYPISCPGLAAAVGWDAVTGLGSPRFMQLSRYVMDIAVWSQQGYYGAPGPDASASSSSSSSDGNAHGIAVAALVLVLLLGLALAIAAVVSCVAGSRRRAAAVDPMTVRWLDGAAMQ